MEVFILFIHKMWSEKTIFQLHSIEGLGRASHSLRIKNNQFCHYILWRYWGENLGVCKLCTFNFWLTKWDLQLYTGSELIFIIEKFFMSNCSIVPQICDIPMVQCHNENWTHDTNSHSLSPLSHWQSYDTTFYLPLFLCVYYLLLLHLKSILTHFISLKTLYQNNTP